MPSGVEHKLEENFAGLFSKVAAAPMPSGVEHMAGSGLSSFLWGCRRRSDAFGR